MNYTVQITWTNGAVGEYLFASLDDALELIARKARLYGNLVSFRLFADNVG